MYSIFTLSLPFLGAMDVSLNQVKHILRILIILLTLFLRVDQTFCAILPCVNCMELHVQLHQNITPIEQIFEDRRASCSSPCECPPEYPQCQDGVPAIMDGCGCCPVCARQQGDICNNVQVCDPTRKLQCTYVDPYSTSGICRVRRGQSCRVGNSIYRDGETFKLDCRTQCTCQNGTYGCVSLCPHENVRPSSRCRHPQLVKMHDSCCREWLCESTLWEDREKHCQHYTSEWSPCSRTCGTGASTRLSNNNPECRLKNETRMCLLRPCTEDGFDSAVPRPSHGHHVRKNHMCRATVRSTVPIRLTDGGNCTSVEVYQPKYCGVCPYHQCCEPHVTTTKKLQFYCVDEDGPNILQKDVLWIIKCNCTSPC